MNVFHVPICYDPKKRGPKPKSQTNLYDGHSWPFAAAGGIRPVLEHGSGMVTHSVPHHVARVSEFAIERRTVV